jgi:hypothetical protein
MRKILSVLAIIGLMLSQTTVHSFAQEPFFGNIIHDNGDELPYENLLEWTNITEQDYVMNDVTFTWYDATLSRIDYPDGNQIWAGSNNSGTATITIDQLVSAGSTIGIRYYFSIDPGSINATYTYSTPATPTPGPAPTSTPYGAPTATATPVPTATPRPHVEATAEEMMIQAREAVTTTIGVITPYDWHSSGASFNFPNLFDGIIGPYMPTIFGYMLALMEIVNTNNVVMIIFVLSLGIAILMIIIKMVSGGSLSGWQSTGIKETLNNPYRSIDKKGRQ